MQVSPLCLGLVGDPDTVIAAWDAGINFFFLTADMHWPLYEGLREGLRRLAKARPQALDEAVIACCTYVAQREFSSAPFQETLSVITPFQKLDVLVAGGSYAADLDGRVTQLKKNIDRGLTKARLVGTSLHDRPAGIDAVNNDKVDLLFVRYNSRHPGARLDFFPHCKKTGRTTKIFNFKSTYSYRRPDVFHALGVDKDTWLPPLVDYYRFVLCRPEIDGLLAAPSSPAQLEALVEAYQAGPLPEDEENHLLALANLLMLDDAKQASL